MKKFSHAWLAFMAVKRLEEAKGLSEKNRQHADSLIEWFRRNKDGVIRGAWYPDSLIKDMATSHVLKFRPGGTNTEFKQLPGTYRGYNLVKDFPLRSQPFEVVDKNDNLPDRCESIAESVVDHLKIQESEERGSAVSPTDNQVALLLFMLSHYVADAHMPFHCDGRQFSEGKGIHAHMEGEWDKAIRHYYKIDEQNERFSYNPEGYPLLIDDQQDPLSFLNRVEDELHNRKFDVLFGSGNKNVWDFMDAVCQNSYLLSYSFIPEGYDHKNVTLENWQTLSDLKFDDLSVAVFSDAIDSIARIWFRLWRRYEEWEQEQRAKKAKKKPEDSKVTKNNGGDDRIRTGV
jgi:hypothetical protein